MYKNNTYSCTQSRRKVFSALQRPDRKCCLRKWCSLGESGGTYRYNTEIFDVKAGGTCSKHWDL
jgi:hypothetical protein